MRDLKVLSAASLSEQLHEVIRRERSCIIESLFLLAELQRRGGHLELGFDSLFTYCLEGLKLSRGSSYRRSVSARLINLFPIVAEYLRDGRLNATTLVMLDGLLTEANFSDVLARASHLTEVEMKRLVATLAPSPSKPDSLRKLPASKSDSSNNAAVSFAQQTIPSASSAAPPQSRSQSSSTAPVATRAVEAPRTTTTAQTLSPTAAVSALPPHRRRGLKIEPINSRDSRVQFDVGPEFVERFEQVRAALSHVVPDGNFEDVFLECFRVTLEACEKRRVGSPRPPAKRRADENGRHPRKATPVRASSTNESGSSLELTSSKRSDSIFVRANQTSASSSLELTSRNPTDSTREHSARGVAGSDLQLTSRSHDDSTRDNAAQRSTSSSLELPRTHADSSGDPGPQVTSSSLEPQERELASEELRLSAAVKPSPYIPASVRRDAAANANGRCTFVGTNGKRCNSQWKLEFDHREPRALGGQSTDGNIRVLCRAHNEFEARRFFGDLFASSFGADDKTH